MNNFKKIPATKWLFSLTLVASCAQKAIVYLFSNFTLEDTDMQLDRLSPASLFPLAH